MFDKFHCLIIYIKFAEIYFLIYRGLVLTKQPLRNSKYISSERDEAKRFAIQFILILERQMYPRPRQYWTWTTRYATEFGSFLIEYFIFIQSTKQTLSIDIYTNSSLLFAHLVCTCLPGYTGNPLTHCSRGECQSDVECSDSRACINYSCVDPCIGQCGSNAICEAKRHLAVCKCPQGFSGDALVSCRQSRSYPVARYYKRSLNDTEHP